MSFRISCPACAAAVRLSRKLRGRKLFCPRCGHPMVIASAGVANPAEQGRAARARPSPDRNWNALLFALIAAVVLVPGGLALIVVGVSGSARTDHKPVAQRDHETRQFERALPERSSAGARPDTLPRQEKPAPGLRSAGMLPRLAPDEAATESHQAAALAAIPLLPPMPPEPVATPQPEDLIVNGSFEEGPDVGQFLSLDEGSTAIPGWTVTRGQIDYIGTFYTAADGSRSLDLNGSPGFGGIAQTFKTKKGQRYRVAFSLAGNPGGDVAVKRLAVSAAAETHEFEFDTTSTTGDNMGWEDQTWEFVATGEETTLEFYSVMEEDPYSGPALDNVSVVAVP